MTKSILGRRDRTGHEGHGPVLEVLAVRQVLKVLVLAVLGVLAVLVPARAEAQRAGDYGASRFDVAIRVVDGGDLEVDETITFQFQSGTFRRVWREIPTSRTDGITIVDAAIDGTPVTPGEGPGHIKISGRNRIRVEWQFEPVGPSVHTFALRYRARGVVFRDGAHDVVRWRLLPSEHRYTIAESRSTIAAPAAVAGQPALETRRIGSASHQQEDGAVAILASNVARNGWLIAELRYPAGGLIATPPAWQQKHTRARELAPRWLVAAAGLFSVCLILLFAHRQSYSRPSVSVDETTATDPPEPLPAGLAAVLAARGGPSGYQPATTLIDLADRGVLAVREVSRTLGVRAYEVSQVPGRQELGEHEREVLNTAFGGHPEVLLSKARGRLARSARRFRAAVNHELIQKGYLDPSRKAVRDRLTVTSVVMLFAAVLTAVAMAALVPRFEGWPFLLPLALGAAGIIGIILAANTSPLSDQGLVQSARWRGFRRYLKSVVEAKDRGSASSFKPRWIVYGIAVGLAPQWARYLKANPGAAPAWFRSLNPDDNGAFAAFIGAQAAAGGGGTAGGGAAAGGGGSGAG